VPTPQTTSIRPLKAVLFIALFAMIATLVPCRIASAQTDSLSSSFTNPPPSARPQVWWHWINGNVSKPGITADLEAFKKVGIGGGTICNLGQYGPDGGVHFNSEAWWDDMHFAMTEAGRLGLELGVEDCQGWSSSGGPWVKPEDAMKMLVWSETQVGTGSPSVITVPQPQTRHGFYRDVAVVAYPSISSESGPNLADISATATAGGQPVDTSFLFSGDADKLVSVPGGTNDNTGITFDCKAPFTADDLRFTHGQDFNGHHVIVSYSNDGTTWATATTAGIYNAEVWWFNSIRFNAVTARYFRVSFTDDGGNPTDVNLSSLNLYGSGTTGGSVIPKSDIIDVSNKLQPDGTLAWTPPAGNWTIVRFGYTDVGVENHPANQYGIGLECDKLSKIALDHFFTGLMNRVISTAKTVPGHPVKWSLIDSYEVGPQNWTDDLPAAFQKRTGYAITPWLLTQTDRTVGSGDLTNRFNFDFNRTISEMWDSNYYGHFCEILHKAGLHGQVECYGNGTFDTVRSSGLVDMPMTEFWWPGDANAARLAKQVASAAHVYGHKIVGAESFTSAGAFFKETPWNMKIEGDDMFACGVNQYYFHSSPTQPFTDGREPGMTWNYGSFITRNTTWFFTGQDYFKYLQRCQAILQQGHPVGDILAYEGEDGNGSQSLYDPPKGYASDEIDKDLLVDGVTVENGVLKLPDGQSYRLLTLANTQNISLPVLEKIESLVKAGAIVFGAPPTHSLGLIDYPNSESKVAHISAELWGNIDGTNVIKNHVGKGWVYWTGDFNKPDAALTDQNVGPDFRYDDKDAKLVYTHRQIAATDVYFLSNQGTNFVSTNASFRVSGKRPEIWDPQKATISNAPVWRAASNGATTVPLHLAPGQSLFIVFKTAVPANHLISVTPQAAQASQQLTSLVITKATYGAAVNTSNYATIDITQKIESLISGTNVHVVISNDLAGGDPAVMTAKQAVIDYTLNGQPNRAVVPEGSVFEIGLSEAESKYQVVKDANGTTKIVAWAPETFEIKSTNGQSRVAVNPPKPFTVDGPWTVHFDPRWGGPASIVFDSLVDWTQRPEPGIKYYSGTAQYDKTVDVPANWLRSGSGVILDLGNLESLANVTINGHYLGCLWSPPYRVDVTGIIKPGPNTFHIAITDSWANRLIGDAGLPTGQRYSFTEEQFFSPSDILVPSGLFGPVTLIGTDTKAL
jgi:hypothetical protein